MDVIEQYEQGHSNTKIEQDVGMPRFTVTLCFVFILLSRTTV